MSIISYIEKLRSKPESDRKKIAVGIAVTMTAVIFIVWAFTIVSSISSISSSDVNQAAPTKAYDDVKKSWNLLIDNVSGFFSDFSTTSPVEIVDENASLDAMEGIPADVVEVDTISTTSPIE